MRIDQVDVVIPSIGRPSLLRAVRSVLDQDLRSRAIVALDAPNEKDTVRAMLPDSDRVKIVETAGRQGGAVARNTGVEVATADAIAFLDDDDWWEPSSVSQRIGTISGLKPFFVASAFIHEKEDGSVAVPREQPPFGDIAAVASYLVSRPDLVFGRSALQSSTMIVSADVARKVPWNAALKKHQDWDFALRVLGLEELETGWLSTPTVHVEKDSTASVSRRLSVDDSLEFLAEHPEIQGRARADFLAVHVLRAALATRSWYGFRRYSSAGGSVPHLAALIVGASGLVSGKAVRK